MDSGTDKSPSIAFMTLGCKVNYYETEMLIRKFSAANFRIVQYDEYADIYVVNTCTVTNIADRKSRKMLHRAKRINGNAIVVALGCFAHAEGDSLSADNDIDLVIGNDKKDMAFEIIMEACKERFADTCYDGNRQNDDIINYMSERTRAYIKIQDGCNQFCSYCKIPYVRGRLKSDRPEDVIRRIRKLAEKGFKEVVVTGIHLSSYGVDLQEKPISSFVELEGKPLLEVIKAISEIEEIKRIRLGSLEPRIITDGFVKALSGIAKVCPHFHLSLQSGCDKTLENMNRKYKTDEYFEACNIIRKYFDRPALTTDIIVGFPEETEEDFKECEDYMKKVRFSDVHIFKYSKRDGTRAAKMSGQVNEKVKNERSRILIETGKELTKEYISAFADEPQICLVEETIEMENKIFWSGHNERYIKILFPYESGDDMENQLICVNPVSIGENNILFCERPSVK